MNPKFMSMIMRLLEEFTIIWGICNHGQKMQESIQRTYQKSWSWSWKQLECHEHVQKAFEKLHREIKLSWLWLWNAHKFH